MQNVQGCKFFWVAAMNCVSRVLLIFVLIPANAVPQQEAPTGAGSGMTSSANTSLPQPASDSIIQLKVVCVLPETILRQPCIYELSEKVGYSRLQFSYMTDTRVEPCTGLPTCDATSCLCCTYDLLNAQTLFQTFLNAEVKYTRLVEEGKIQPSANQSPENGEETIQALVKLQKASYDLQPLCPERYCDGINCAYIGCKLRHCNSTRTPASEPPSIVSPTVTKRTNEKPDSTSTTGTTYFEMTSKATAASVPEHTATTSTSGLTGGNDQGANVTVIALSIVLVMLVVAGIAVFVIFWWRRKKQKDGGLMSHRSPSTVAFVFDTEADSSPYSELSEVDRRDKNAEYQVLADSRESGHEYSYIPADLVGTSGSSNGPIDEAGYDVVRDVATRKLPCLPGHDDDYTLNIHPQDGKREVSPKPSAPQESVYSLASAEDRKNVPLNPAGGQKAETSAEEQEGASQYFQLEEDAADDDKEQKDSQYFILEEGEAKDEGEDRKDGQYFILDEDAADGNKEQGQSAQYFILEEETSGASTSTGTGSTHAQRNPDTEYISLNRPDMVSRERNDQDSEYTALDKSRSQSAASQRAKMSSELDVDSDYSLQRPT